jgi:hypothetical protein
MTQPPLPQLKHGGITFEKYLEFCQKDSLCCIGNDILNPLIILN